MRTERFEKTMYKTIGLLTRALHAGWRLRRSSAGQQASWRACFAAWPLARAAGRLLSLAFVFLAGGAGAQQPLRVVATLPDLASIARSIGGEWVVVDSLLRGGEDPHFVEPRPSFIKLLSAADVFLVAGLDLELGYGPRLLQGAHNPRILPGSPGYVDCSRAIVPLEVPAAPVDRSMGDVHPYGNPHYWLDPLNGVRVAALVAEALASALPQQRATFEANRTAFRQQVLARLVGERLAQQYDAEKLALLAERGRLEEFLRTQGDLELLSGWLGVLAPYRGFKAVDDHNMWPYFARRFGFEVIGHMEPKPGIPPTTKALSELVERMRAHGVRIILSSPYYDPKHARFLAEQTGARVVPLAHITGSRPGTDDYLAMIDYNVRELARALAAEFRAPAEAQ